ncbi:hypothetical protein FKP32DRAFT_143652 [Trametes sanguinea]|nr:hypothetical protein FKP32DRAFT_143652 [Trametes sanguinea]
MQKCRKSIVVFSVILAGRAGRGGATRSRASADRHASPQRRQQFDIAGPSLARGKRFRSYATAWFVAAWPLLAPSFVLLRTRDARAPVAGNTLLERARPQDLRRNWWKTRPGLDVVHNRK